MTYISTLIGSALKSVVLHPVKLELIWDNPDIKNLKDSVMDYYKSDENDDEYDEIDELNLILKNIENNGWNAILLPNIN
jgi:hypothetical protein